MHEELKTSSRSKSCAASLPSINQNQTFNGLDELITDFHRCKIPVGPSRSSPVEPKVVRSCPNPGSADSRTLPVEGFKKPIKRKTRPNGRKQIRRPLSSHQMLPSIKTPDQNNTLSYKWKCANQVRMSKEDMDEDGFELTDDSGDDLTDCESDSEISTLISRQSTVSCEAYSDAKVEEDFIPLMRANPYSYLFTSTVRFVYGLEHKLTPPPKMPKLVWKNSTMTPRVVRKLLNNSHFEIIESGKSWIGYFGKHLKGQNYRKMKQGQKVNHFPGCFVLGRKDRLWRTISRFIAKFGHSQYGFIPTTYILPRDRRLLKENWKSNESYIMKPVASARGIGIKMVSKIDQIPKKRPVIIQNYIRNPLLINGLKWDLRIYVFVTSFSPLVAYIADDGLVRFSTEKFSLSTRNRFVHLTNYSINKKSKKFQSNQDAGSAEGHKWSMKILWGELQKQGYDTVKIWEDIKDVVLKTLIAAEGHIVQQVHKHCASQGNCFELFGFDIMLDRTGSVILLEVNVSPSLHSNSKLDQDIKGNLIADVFNTTGFSPYKPKPIPPVTSADRQANAKIFQRCLEMKNIELLNSLSSYHQYLILKIESERLRKGNLERLMPKPGAWLKYRKYFETLRIDNAVLAAFEDEYGDSELKRKAGAEKIYQIHTMKGRS